MAGNAQVSGDLAQRTVTSEVREVTSPSDRAIGAEVTNSARYCGAQVIAAFTEPMVDYEGEQYTPAIDELARDLRSAMAAVAAGSMARPEEMLLAQAHALQAIFTEFALRAAGPWSATLTPLYMSLALKAQAQSRATLSALADVRHPRQAAFIGQQNVALNQQVNNAMAHTAGHGDTSSAQSRLLERESGD